MSDLPFYDSTTDPSAGDSVVASGTLTAGRYRAVVTTMPSGTVGAGDLNNVQLQVGDTAVVQLVQIPTTGTPWTNPPIAVTVPPAGAAISVTAVGDASGADVVYNALLVIGQLAVDE